MYVIIVSTAEMGDLIVEALTPGKVRSAADTPNALVTRNEDALEHVRHHSFGV
jgi:hypothetical protein